MIVVKGGIGNKTLITFHESDEIRIDTNEKQRCEYCGRFTTEEICQSCGAPINWN